MQHHVASCPCGLVSALQAKILHCGAAFSPRACSRWCPSPLQQTRAHPTHLFQHEPQRGHVSPHHPASPSDIHVRNPFHPATHAQRSLSQGGILPDEPVGGQVRRSVSSIGRIGRFERFPLTRGSRQWKVSSRSCQSCSNPSPPPGKSHSGVALPRPAFVPPFVWLHAAHAAPTAQASITASLECNPLRLF